MTVKWKKADVIKAFEEALGSEVKKSILGGMAEKVKQVLSRNKGIK